MTVTHVVREFEHGDALGHTSEHRVWTVYRVVCFYVT